MRVFRRTVNWVEGALLSAAVSALVFVVERRLKKAIRHQEQAATRDSRR